MCFHVSILSDFIAFAVRMRSRNEKQYEHSRIIIFILREILIERKKNQICIEGQKNKSAARRWRSQMRLTMIFIDE